MFSNLHTGAAWPHENRRELEWGRRRGVLSNCGSLRRQSIAVRDEPHERPMSVDGIIVSANRGSHRAVAHCAAPRGRWVTVVRVYRRHYCRFIALYSVTVHCWNHAVSTSGSRRKCGCRTYLAMAITIYRQALTLITYVTLSLSSGRSTSSRWSALTLLIY